MQKKLKLIVLYDSWCPICTRTTKIIRSLDAFNLIHLISFRESKDSKIYSIPVGLLEQEMYSVSSHNKIYSGYDTILQIAVRTPLILIYPLLYLMKISKIGYFLYRHIAKNRKIVCDSSCRIPN
jgi:predicted DCC family thiol-disulfide oxidoreductase YuxK